MIQWGKLDRSVKYLADADMYDLHKEDCFMLSGLFYWGVSNFGGNATQKRKIKIHKRPNCK